jgi:plastocyanin
MARRAIVALALAALIIALAGCGGGNDNKAQALDATPAKGVTKVQMHNLKFAPAVIEVPAGTTVTWEFTDGSVPHNVSGQGYTSPTQARGTFTHRFAQAGTYDYRCTLHTGMQGRVIVK